MMDRTVHMRDVALALPEETGEAIRRIRIVSMKMDDGSVQAVVELDDGHYYQILSEYVGMPITVDWEHLHLIFFGHPGCQRPRLLRIRFLRV